MIPAEETAPPKKTRSRRKPAAMPAPAPAVPMVPAWALARGNVETTEDVALRTGAALTALDQVVRADHYWSGVWRQRLALGAAVSAVRLAGRGEDEAALRDAWCLRRPGDELGPVGDIYAAWKRLGLREPALGGKALQEVAALMSIRWSDALGDIPGWLDDLLQEGRPAPFVASALVGRIHSQRPDAEMLGWWCADMALAQAMRWPRAVPLLMAQRHGAAFRSIGGRGRVRPGEPAFERAVLAALVLAAAEACRLGGDLQRRAEKLAAVTPLLRAKGAGDALRLLLDDDAVSGTLATPRLTRWASRRLFERLSELDAVRELSGRTTFRLYGL